MLRAIDIAHPWQDGIDPANVDCDIVIVKVSGGTCYTNPKYREWADAALASGKLLGFYHYACEQDTEPGGKAEADYFWAHVKDYKGRFVPILDWENHAHQMPVSYAKAFLDRIAELSGATPMFYGYAANVNSTDYSSIAHYPFWMASYLDRYNGSGWVDDPTNTWGTGDWDGMLMYQYTSTGYIGGYWDRLDLSVFYGDRGDWIRLEGGSMGNKERMVQIAVSVAEDDSHGYSQAMRWPWEGSDFDCSSLAYWSAHEAGYHVPLSGYTGTMLADFTAAGFTAYDYGTVELQRGDVLLAHNSSRQHVEIYIGDGYTVGAHCSETGGIYGEPGDQTGDEISVAPLWGNWDWVLRPQDGGSSMGEWIEEGGKWWYKHPGGGYTSNNWEYINGKWYFFDESGWMVTGWKLWKGYWYYLLPKSAETGDSYGYMVTGWKKIKYKKITSWFCFDPNGAMFQGCFAIINGKWYGFDKDGRMVDDPTDLKFSKDGDISFA